MKSFKKFISEARSNPDRNEKVSAYAALLPYSDDEDIYISLTDIDKIGINPLSKFNTPLGIYTYPLKDAWTMYNIDLKRSLIDIPYAANRPYIWIVRAKPQGFVDDMYNDYGSNDYDNDVIKLKAIFDAQPIYKEFVSYDHEGDLHIAQQNVDKFQDMVDESEPDPTDPSQMRLLDKLKLRLTQWQEELERLQSQFILTWDELVDNALEHAKVKNPIMSFWNLSRLMANAMTRENQGIRTATKWNSILRQCGYTGFADKSARGYIHPSEPMQAVFLTRNAFTVVDKIPNVNYVTIDENVTTFRQLAKLIESGIMTIKQAMMILDKAEDFGGKMIYMGKYEINLNSMMESPDGQAVNKILTKCGLSEWSTIAKPMVMRVWKNLYEKGLFDKCQGMTLALKRRYDTLAGNIGYMDV